MKRSVANAELPGLGPISLYVKPVDPIVVAFHCELVNAADVSPAAGVGAAVP